VAAKGGGQGKRPTRATGRSATKRAGAAKGSTKGRRASTTKPKRTAAATKPKATPEDLIPFLERLEPGDREVVASVDGLGRATEPLAAVARRLGRSEDDVEAAAKRARFKLRMAYGKARAADAGPGAN
jgi:DNA topoisomerase-1